MLQNLTGWHFLIILVVILLLFGAPKLPGLARSLGQSMKIFKSEITPDRTEDATPDRTEDATSDRKWTGKTPADPSDRSSADASTDSSGPPNPKA
ncbi:Sec-independent protein translocase subunit TatA [Cryobacterium sp. PH31-O1]|uniref:Sec-independent protein translocase subunit TatA n=1 Tax=Cryobacterium sp. PH31-O1 TaxID=3046306 RepID=UPI0024B8DE05|nr:Sec-independent protein translocase subunit TatA [Cryobacterium sp. PH31-O1]MDJ0339164.1 Sec-independent protein translocase subunit TatA [Cryobacterium sp. PH31-O1]